MNRVDWLARFLNAKRTVKDVGVNLGRGSKRLWQSGPIAKGAILGAGAGAAYGASNAGRKYKAKGFQRVRRGASGAISGSFYGAAGGALYRLGRGW